ncbi:MAG: hypothetical protein R6V86_09140 [Spirochaetia bacterium]
MFNQEASEKTSGKKQRHHNLRKGVFTGLLLFLFLSSVPPFDASANEEFGNDGKVSGESTRLLPASEPFTLNLYDAQMAEALLWRVGMVEVRTGANSTRLIRVKKVRIEYVAKYPELPEPFQKRFDIRLNGQALEWNKTYIEYDFRMVNMRMLFTYRNERPVPNVPYYLDESGP